MAFGRRHRMQRQFLFCIALLATSVPVHATTRTWPGTAPCDTTLQACINASVANDTVEVASNGVIDESPSFTFPLTLRNANGYAPQLAADRVIGVYPSSN